MGCQAHIAKSSDHPTQHFEHTKGKTERRNFFLGVLNGAIFKVTMLSIDPQTVLAWFLIQLGVSNFYIGRTYARRGIAGQSAYVKISLCTHEKNASPV